MSVPNDISEFSFITVTDFTTWSQGILPHPVQSTRDELWGIQAYDQPRRLYLYLISLCLLPVFLMHVTL